MLVEELDISGIKMLLYLLDVGESNKNQIRIKAAMGVEGVLNAINNLNNLGLLTERPGKGSEKLLSLSEKGKRVAIHLDAAEKGLSKGA